MLIGFVHGLAGSGAMILLTMSTVKSAWEASLFMLIFGVGTVIGMLLFTTIIGLPFVMSTKKINLNTTLTKLTGSISVVFGLYYMYNLGITEGLFQLWLH
jgi:sulfite exporter TauE/SafE